ncbi:CtrA inhibitor SciP [Limimaricola variabilis]
MYLRKIDGPRAVTLPDGRMLTRADLPARDTGRWVASRKARLLLGIASGLISRERAIADYGLSEEELASWERLAARHGSKGLRATSIQKYRQP